MGFMLSGGVIQGSENTSPWTYRKCSSFPSLTGTNNTKWEISVVCMSMDEEAIIKATCRFKTPVQCCRCSNYPIYHADRFHTYRNSSQNRDSYVAEQENISIQQYYQCTYMIGGRIIDQGSQGQCGQTYTMAVHSIFAERRVQITRSWKEEGFVSLDHALLMCGIMDPSTYISVRLACAGDLKVIYERQNHKSENEYQIVGPNPN